MQDKIILISIPKEELQLLIRNAVKAELSNLNKRKRLLTSEEICSALKISRSGLNNLKSSGKIPYARLGKRIFYDLDEIIASMKEGGNYKKLKELKTYGDGE